MNNSLIDLLHLQQKMQNDTTYALQVIYLLQWDDSLTDDITTFKSKPDLYFDWILKLGNTAVVTKCNPKELALGKAQGTLMKCSKSLTSSSQAGIMLKLFWGRQFSFDPTITYTATWVMHKYQQKGESL